MRKISRIAYSMFLGLIACSGHRLAHAQTLSIPNPDNPAKKIEYFIEKPLGNGPWRTVVFLHGHQDSPRLGGRAFVNWGVLDDFASRGYLAVSISQPGYGNSTGPADFCGPLTQHAVAAVLSILRAEGYVRDGDILIEGISRGALVAGLVAAHDPSIRAIVLISGAYDLQRYVQHPKSPTAASIATDIKAETGGGQEALKERSLIDFAPRIKAATLILSGAKDDRTDPEEAQLLAKMIKAHGGHAQAIIYPEYGHQIPVEVRERDVDAFIRKALN